MAFSFLEATASAAQASISVILVLFYGWLARRQGLISNEGESNISKLGTTLLLPALLFSEIGPLATLDNLKNFWPIIPLSLFFQLVSLLFALLLAKTKFIPEHFVPLFIFNNVTSLPLLLIESLGGTGSLDGLTRVGESMGEAVLKRGRVYILINALVGNLTRFALGPYLMTTHPDAWIHQHHESPYALIKRSLTPPLPTSTEHDASSDHHEHSPLLPSKATFTKPLTTLGRAGKWLEGAINPPLQGGLAAMLFGVVGPVRRVVFEKGWDGWVDPITQSISKLGGLFTALQMFVLGAHLFSKPSSPVAKRVLVTLFLWRFLFVPIISIGTVHLIRRTWPSLMVSSNAELRFSTRLPCLLESTADSRPFFLASGQRPHVGLRPFSLSRWTPSSHSRRHRFDGQSPRRSRGANRSSDHLELWSDSLHLAFRQWFVVGGGEEWCSVELDWEGRDGSSSFVRRFYVSP